MYKRTFLFIFITLFALSTQAQQITVSGIVKDSISGKGIPYATFFISGHNIETCDASGRYTFSIQNGSYTTGIRATAYQTKRFQWNITSANQKDVFTLQIANNKLSVLTISRARHDWDLRLLTQTQGTHIFAGKKNEFVDMNKLQANKAVNNARQIFAKIPGVNIIENDEAGIQLSIATRGLNPNRTTAFNTRQNGYDISADPIGYPETYYTPPADALSGIEIIRGAASLQYGTQFGGLLNFKLKHGSADNPFELVTKQTAGSYGFFNSFNSIGGQYKKLNYYAFYNYKRGDGWRQNTGFGVHNAYTALKYKLAPGMKLGVEYSFMKYRMKQPGGLTDKQFKENPRQSLRDRNWFTATWNIPVVTFDDSINANNLLSAKVYALLADRKNVGNLQSITAADHPYDPRTVMSDTYRNYYMEARFMHHYFLINNLRSSLLTGIRLYHGNTHRIQGYNYKGSGPDFSVKHNDSLLIDYRFPSYNVALFAENVFQLTPRFSVTPGIRFEYIQTNGIGYISDTITRTKALGDEHHTRKFPLFGIGLEYKISKGTNAYANFSQNYSPVNFGDIIILNPTMRVDPNLKDVKGYNADIGYRGTFKDIASFDLSMYYMLYRDRIGTLQQVDGNTNVYQYKTNIGDSRSLGTELYASVNVLHLINEYSTNDNKISLYGSMSYTSAKYINVPDSRKQLKGKRVEYAPPWIDRAGIDFLFNNFSGSIEYSYTDAEYSDASNATESLDAHIGIIPSYNTMDVTVSYRLKQWMLSLSVNNLTNTMYFTRRTTGFPGPGIIPSEGRSFYATVQFKL